MLRIVYQSLEKIEGRALIISKIFIIGQHKNKFDLLFLKRSFQKRKFANIYSEFLSDRLKELDARRNT